MATLKSAHHTSIYTWWKVEATDKYSPEGVIMHKVFVVSCVMLLNHVEYVLVYKVNRQSVKIHEYIIG